MCGIVGLFIKNPSLKSHLGELFAPMLETMCARGSDSTGFAVYSDETGDHMKISLQHPNPEFDWDGVQKALEEKFGGNAAFTKEETHAFFQVDASDSELRAFFSRRFPDVMVMSIGKKIRIVKETGPPEEVARRFKLPMLVGSHAIGHTRMATESAVNTAGSHPFSTGLDLCLVHNGSLSNHNSLRRDLKRRGIQFKTENDSEVAAGYLEWQLREGKTLHEALKAALDDLDGFYTFAAGSADGFAILRDRIAWKPAILAETDDFVAMASEYRALVHLPGIRNAKLWEPEPGIVYSWSHS